MHDDKAPNEGLHHNPEIELYVRYKIAHSDKSGESDELYIGERPEEEGRHTEVYGMDQLEWLIERLIWIRDQTLWGGARD